MAQKVTLVKVNRLTEDAVIPKYAREGDAGMDLTATSVWFNNEDQIGFGTGLSIEIPEGYVGLIFPRSSIYKTNMSLSNCVGVIDSGYRGEIKFCFNYVSSTSQQAYKVGDRVGQIIVMPIPYVDFVEVRELTTSERGGNGFGSTGK